MSRSTGLKSQRRYITTHDVAGSSVFTDRVNSTASYERINQDVEFFLGYANTTFPVEMGADHDLTGYEELLAGPQPPISLPGGTVLRVCNFAPGSVTPMHRTLSLDFGIVISGKVELLLDSGESRLLEPGDIAVQRGTMHAWRTPSTDTWSRMVFILQGAKTLEINGKQLAENYGGIEVPKAEDWASRHGDETD